MTKLTFSRGVQRVRDSVLSQLRELNKSKPRNNADENLLVEITRLESSLTLAKDDLVGKVYSPLKFKDSISLQAALVASLKGKRDELKHTRSELRKKSPELQKVSGF